MKSHRFEETLTTITGALTGSAYDCRAPLAISMETTRRRTNNVVKRQCRDGPQQKYSAENCAVRSICFDTRGRVIGVHLFIRLTDPPHVAFETRTRSAGFDEIY